MKTKTVKAAPNERIHAANMAKGRKMSLLFSKMNSEHIFKYSKLLIKTE